MPRSWRRATLAAAVAVSLLAAALFTVRDLRAAARFEPLRSVAAQNPVIALTFEVARGDAAVPAILKTLGRERATFFITGAWAAGHEPEVARILAAGDEVESLGNRPVALTRYPDSVVREELAAASAALRRAGASPRFLRPPGGLYGPDLLRLADAADLRLCLWDIDAGDWAHPGVDAIVARVLGAAHRGAIVRLQADDDLAETAAALPAILRGLAARGLKPVTLTQLLGPD